MESDRLYRGKTRECWIQRLEEIRKRYQKYRAILEDHLKEQGIILKPAYTDGLDETGRPQGLRIIGERGIEKKCCLSGRMNMRCIFLTWETAF